MATLTSSFAIGYINRATGKTITASTSATGYPASSLNTPALTSAWRSTAGSLTSQDITVDLTSSQDIEVMALIGANLSDTATRTPKTGETSNLLAPEFNPGSGNAFDVSYNLPLSSTHRYGRNVIVLPGVTYNSRYVRFTLDNAGLAANFLSARVFWVGSLWQPVISFGMKEGSYKVRMEFVGEPGLERGLTFIDVSFEALTEAEGKALQAICMARLRSGRLLVIPRPTQPATWQGEALYCTLSGLPTLSAWPQGGGLNYWRVNLTFKECED